MRKFIHTRNVTWAVYVHVQFIQMRLLPPKQKYTMTIILYKYFPVETMMTCNVLTSSKRSQLI